MSSTEHRPGENDEFAGAGEYLRVLALGLTAALVTMRFFFPSEPDLKAEGGPGLSWAFAVLIVAGLALIAGLVGGRLRLRCSWVDAAVIALMVLVGVSSSHAADWRTSVNLAWQWVAVGFAYLLIRALPKSRAESTVLAGCLVATAVAVGVYGLYQVGVELEQIRSLYRANPEHTLRQLGIAPDSPARTLLENRILHSNEPWSTFALANSLAGFLVGPLVLLIAVAWQNVRTPEGRTSRGVALALAAVPGLFMFVCLLMTKSRSAYVGLAVALAALAWRERKSVRLRTWIITAVVGAVLLGALIGAGLATKRLDLLVLTESPKSLRYRMQYWTGAWQVITKLHGASWRGVGPGNFGSAYLLYKAPDASEEITDPHDMFLDVWATAGVFAAVALTAALGLAFWNLLRPVAPTKLAAEVRAGSLQTTAESEQAPRLGWLVGASGLGALLVVIMGELNPFMGDMLSRWTVLVVAWVCAVMFGQVLWRRIPIEGSAFGLAAVAVSVNLLAAGGIGIPSVALGLWMPIALGLNLRDDRSCARLRTVGDRGAIFLLAAVWAAVIGLFWGSVVPFWRSEREIAQAEAILENPMIPEQTRYNRARDAYLRAVTYDHYSARPWLGQAKLEYQAWVSSKALPENKLWQRIPMLLVKATTRPRNEHSWTLHQSQAMTMRAILDHVGTRLPAEDLIRYRADIVRAANLATQEYPNNASLHALMAESSADVGHFGPAAAQADEALRLDDLMPHLEKKLPAATRKRLEEQLPIWRTAARGTRVEP